MDHIINGFAANEQETRIPLEELNGKSAAFDSALDYSYGLLTYYSKAAAFIAPFTAGCQKANFERSKMVLVDPSRASFLGEDIPIRPAKRTYLVRYVDGGMTLNPKTGESQATIDYSVPVVILLSPSKKQCRALMMENGTVLILKASGAVPEVPGNTGTPILRELNEEATARLKARLEAEIADKGFVYFSNFPGLMKEVLGTADFRQYASGIGAFIDLYYRDTFRWEKTYFHDGKTIPGVILPRTDKAAESLPRQDTEGGILPQADPEAEGLPPAADVEILDRAALIAEAAPGQEGEDWHLGVISYRKDQTSFINPGYNDASDRKNSVIFHPASARFVPDQAVLDTFKNLYLVLFKTSGTVLNTKTGQEHMAFDYSFPVIILRTFPKSDCVFITISDDAVRIGRKPAESSLDQSLKAIRGRLSAEISDRRYFLASEFPRLAGECGLANFRDYAENVGMFLERYFPGYVLLTNVSIEGKLCPGVIVEKGRNPFESQALSETRPEEEDRADSSPGASFDVFHQLFEEGRYAQALSCGEFRDCPPQKLPLEILEKALTAADRLLYPGSREEIRLNGFQQEVFYTRMTDQFIKKWKRGGQFDESIIEQCCDTALAVLDPRYDLALAVRLLNAIGFKRTENNNYNGITARFTACENSLIPHFYILRAFVQNTAPSLNRILQEYCQLVRDMKHAAAAPKLSDDARLCSFEEVLRVVREHLAESEAALSNLRTNIVSAFFAYGKVEKARSVLSLLDPAHASLEWRLVNLYYAYEGLDEGYFVKLIEDGCSIQLLQRCVALIWGNFDKDSILPAGFLRLLSWIVIHEQYSSIEDSIRYPSSRGLNPLDKNNMLVNSFVSVCSLAEEDSSMYALASFIARFMEPDPALDVFTEEVKEKLAGWGAWSESFYQREIDKAGPLSEETEDRYIQLFAVFQLDTPHYLLLQETYSEWFRGAHGAAPETAEEAGRLLDLLTGKKACGAYAEIYAQSRHLDLGNQAAEYLRLYVQSLIRLHRYADAAAFLMDAPELTAADRIYQLSRVLGENFREHGLSPAAFSCFGDHLSCEKAIDLLLPGLDPMQVPLINSLIALYIYRAEYMKAAYLLVLYSSRADRGYVRLYGQFRGRLTQFMNLTALKSHHHVAALAFRVLGPDRLISFLHWAKGIKIPNFRQRKENHIFQYYFDSLIADPDNKEVWAYFLNHLLKNGLDKNAWNICVCETILRHVLQGGNTSFSETALDILLRSAVPGAQPPAFLVYAFLWIEDRKSAAFCQKILTALSDGRTYAVLIGDNPWFETYRPELDSFKDYCFRAYEETGNSLYHEILNALGTGLTVRELGTASAAASSKKALIAAICRNYLEGRDLDETLKVFHSVEQTGLSDSDREAFAILGTIFEEDDLLLTREADIFEDEETVQRFKRDCAGILQFYPEKTGLFRFHSSCLSESHRMLVYSSIFRVLYDDDLYDQMDRQYSDFTGRRDFLIYLRLMTASYKAQSIRNTTYPNFYKRWRYSKLYLALCLLASGEPEEEPIIRLMKMNGHYDEFYASSYVPFVEAVRDFRDLPGLTEEFRTHFLFAIMVSHAEDLFAAYAKDLAALSDTAKGVCRRLIEGLDYRYFNASLYAFFSEDLKHGRYVECLSVSEAVSSYARDAVRALAGLHTESAFRAFTKLGFGRKPGQVLSEFLSMDPEELSSCHEMLIPLVCSRQFVFYVNDRFRFLVIQQRDKGVCEKYAYVSDYLTHIGNRSAKTVQAYLWALYYCLRGDRDNALKAIAGTDLSSQVPEQWKKEAGNIAAFASGGLKMFRPDRSIVDGSQENKGGIADFSFASEILSRVFGRTSLPVTDEEASALNEQYIYSRDAADRVRMGLSLLVWLSSHRIRVKTEFPSPNSLALDVGLLILKPEAGMPQEVRFQAAASLFRNRSVYQQQEYAARFETLRQGFLDLLGSDPGLAVWVRHASVIEDLLRESRMVLDFSELRERILEKCALLASPDIAYDEKEAGYEALLGSFAGLTSSWSRSVMRAIREERRVLGDGIRLSVTIEEPQISDGKLYFQIRNTGSRAVSFTSDRLAAVLQQEDQPEVEIDIANIRDLQCASLTGASAPVILPKGKSGITARVCVFRNPGNGTRELVCQSGGTFPVTRSEDMTVPEDAEYDVRSAVSEESMLFGRSPQKELLRKCIPMGVTLIYGPSRIGKTSLMNWVRNSLAPSRGNVMTLVFGGENGLGKESDYVRNLLDRSCPVPYGDDYEMSRYLLVDTLIYGFTRRNRLFMPSGKQLPPDLIPGILRVLRDDGTDIISKYYEMNGLLEAAGVELWLMLDEFQQVVERWAPQKWSDFVEICSLLSSRERNRPGSIKLIICGSDDLLKHMTLKRDSVWKSAFRTTVSVEALEEKDFTAMIREDPAVAGTNLRFSDMALHTLYVYTGGVALYGKEICNAMLEDIRTSPGKYRSRTCLYTADVSEATQRLLNRQSDELSTRAREGISGIYAAVTKNLDEATDMQMLWYMAKWLYENKRSDAFPESIFRGAMLHPVFAGSLGDSIRIAEARGIIRHRNSLQNNETVYEFTTLFYFYAFYGSAAGNLDESLIFAQTEEEAEKDGIPGDDPYDFHRMIEIARDFDERFSVKDQRAFLGVLALSSDPSVQASLKSLAGVSQTGQIFNGDVKILQINQIASSLAGLSDLVKEIAAGTSDFNEERLQGYLEEMPRLRLLPAGEPVAEGDDLSIFDTDAYVETVEEGVKKSFGEDDGSAGSSLADWARDHIDELSEMGVSEEELDYVLGLPERDCSSILVALYLRSLFDQIVEMGENAHSSMSLDYAPITIMLGKTLERLLQERHLPIYLNPAVWVHNVHTYSSETQNKGARIRFTGPATIGTFWTAMTAMFNIQPSDPETAEKEEIRNLFVERTGTIARWWRPYLNDLTTARDIRNKTAHVDPVTQEDCDRFVEIFFRMHLLKNTIEYVPDPS